MERAGLGLGNTVRTALHWSNSAEVKEMQMSEQPRASGEAVEAGDASSDHYRPRRDAMRNKDKILCTQLGMPMRKLGRGSWLKGLASGHLLDR
ncbi:hypothetical protein HYALB_00006991 [Hymenoscyphus albidus]|uniref:Uncharacterized protein n=1 Tax=Hymenoscyphus albidus TaxID=595503 RepID=A0A9N9LJY6_9HELO|nr:hypothetical protein HYALB_00006991 [Hymenoscyphus albidus]